MCSQILTTTEIVLRLKNSYQQKNKPESPYPSGYSNQEPTPAAVLIPLHQINQIWHILFIRRTVDPQDHHSGQVAYPGGRRSHLDRSAEENAIRETQEEIGVKPGDIRILGRTRDMLTITNYQVTPIVGVIPWPYQLVPQQEEVAHIFSIPLDWLANPAHREVRMRGLQILGQDIPVIYFKKFNSELLWGASARITLIFLEAIGLAKPEERYLIK